jgi:hypothetical protein
MWYGNEFVDGRYDGEVISLSSDKMRQGRIWILKSEAKRDGSKMNLMVTKDKYTTTMTMMSMAEDRERNPDRII